MNNILREFLKALIIICTMGIYNPKASPPPGVRIALAFLAAAALAAIILLAGCAAETNVAAGGYVGHWDTHIYMVKTAEVPAPALPGERPPAWTRSSSTTEPASP